MKYLIGIDVGTSGTKAVLFDTEGTVINSCTEEYPLIQPKVGWAEQDPHDWWNAVKKALTAITAGVDKNDIAGLGLTGQMHGLVMLDDAGEVLTNAIIWCDGRTTEECREIERIIGKERLIEITANPALEGFTAGKIMWQKKHNPEVWAKCRHILLPKDYIRYKLTGDFATDVSDASGMQLMDIAGRCWSEEVCTALGIDMAYLPKLYESPEITGGISGEVAELTGLPAGLPVCAGGGDNAAAAIGTGVFCDGKSFTTVGTSGVVFAHTSKPLIDPKGRVHTFCCAVPGEWHVMGVTQAAGLSVNWFRNSIAKELSYKEIDAECENIPAGSDKLIYLPYLMGERTPLLDANAKGVFFGLSAKHTKAHMARAVMEGVAYSLNDCLGVLAEMGVNVNDMAICGGGGKSKFWRGMIADVLDLDLKLLQNDEGPALGAALLAGCGVGIYSSVADACERTVKVKDTVKHDCARHAEYGPYYEIYKGLYGSLKGDFEKLAKI